MTHDLNVAMANHSEKPEIVAAFPLPATPAPINQSVKRPGPMDGSKAWSKYRAGRYGAEYARQWDRAMEARKQARSETC